MQCVHGVLQLRPCAAACAGCLVCLCEAGLHVSSEDTAHLHCHFCWHGGGFVLSVQSASWLLMREDCATECMCSCVISHKSEIQADGCLLLQSRCDWVYYSCSSAAVPVSLLCCSLCLCLTAADGRNTLSVARGLSKHQSHRRLWKWTFVSKFQQQTRKILMLFIKDRNCGTLRRFSLIQNEWSDSLTDKLSSAVLNCDLTHFHTMRIIVLSENTLRFHVFLCQYSVVILQLFWSILLISALSLAKKSMILFLFAQVMQL